MLHILYNTHNAGDRMGQTIRMMKERLYELILELIVIISIATKTSAMVY